MQDPRLVTKLGVGFNDNVWRVFRNFIVENFEFFGFVDNFIRKIMLAEFALKFFPVVGEGELGGFGFSAGLEPVLEALEMDVLHGAVAAAGADEGVF